MDDPAGRRQFLKVMGASMALAGLTGCTRQPEKIVPYVKPPEEIVPAAALLRHRRDRRRLREGRAGGEPRGAAHQDRGQPRAPGQPGRHRRPHARPRSSSSTTPTARRPSRYLGEIRSWGAFVAAAAAALAARSAAGRRGGLRILTETVTSPTLAAQIHAASPSTRRRSWHQYEPVSARQRARGARWRSASPSKPRYDLAEADVVLSLDADFLGRGRAACATREFAPPARRRRRTRR